MMTDRPINQADLDVLDDPIGTTASRQPALVRFAHRSPFGSPPIRETVGRIVTDAAIIALCALLIGFSLGAQV